MLNKNKIGVISGTLTEALSKERDGAFLVCQLDLTTILAFWLNNSISSFFFLNPRTQADEENNSVLLYNMSVTHSHQDALLEPIGPLEK